jgi:hypothetical protein
MIGDIISLGTTIIDKLFPDKTKADEAKLRLLELQQTGQLKELEARSQIVNTEAASTHWLAANWRPLTMITFVGLIVARWFGWSAPELSEAEYLKLWDIVELGLGGYVVGRSLEKLVPSIAGAMKR